MATHDDDNDGDELIDATAVPETVVEDNGNTPDTPEQIAAAEDARKTALKQVAGEDKMVPLSALQEERDRRKELTAQNEALLQALAATNKAAPVAAPAAAPPAFDMKAARAAHHAALVSGDDAKALELDEQIAEAMLVEGERRALARMRKEQEADSLRVQNEDLQQAGELVKKAYPQLDNKSPNADPDAILFVIAKRDTLVQAGKAPGEALRSAAEQASKLFGFGAGQPTEDVSTARTILARTRNAAAAAAQPPELSGLGNRATRAQQTNVETMTDEEFAALPAAEKKRLRGD